MVSLADIYIKNPTIVERLIGEEMVLVPVYLEKECSVYSLNRTGVIVWKLINGNNSVEEIINKLSKMFKISDAKLNSVKHDIIELVDDMLSQNIIQFG